MASSHLASRQSRVGARSPIFHLRERAGWDASEGVGDVCWGARSDALASFQFPSRGRIRNPSGHTDSRTPADGDARARASYSVGVTDERAPYDPMPHGPPEIGVGPWAGPLPLDEHYDPQLLAEGDRRNVVDRYRYWRMEAIVADLDLRRHDFHVAIENWQHDFNIGTIVRTANAFLAAEVHIVGNRRWNRRGAMVTDRYQHIRHHPDAGALAEYLHTQGIALWGVDNLPGSLPLESATLPRRVCLLFGQEGPGLSESARERCDATFSIAQFGSTRSINASAAAAIAMHSWIRNYADLSAEDTWRG